MDLVIFEGGILINPSKTVFINDSENFENNIDTKQFLSLIFLGNVSAELGCKETKPQC